MWFNGISAPGNDCDIAIEHGHLVRWFTYEKMWFSIAMLPEGIYQHWWV